MTSTIEISEKLCGRNSDKTKLIGVIICWFLLPVLTMIFSILYCLKSSLLYKNRVILYLIVSLTFGLIAFTQTSLSDTDITRYYGQFKFCENLNVSWNLMKLSFDNNLYYIFNPITMAVVSITGNVQYLSLFWISITYMFYFLSCDLYCKFRNITLSRHQFVCFILISIFGFILFTQVSETIKQASAISIFFYGFASFLNKRYGSAILFTIVSIGIHSSPLLLLPLFLYKQIKGPILFSFTFICVLMSTVNIMQIAASILPTVGSLLLISEKINQYLDPNASTASSLLRYDLLMLILLSEYIVLNFYSKRFSSVTANIILIFVCLVIANRFMIQNYCRFVNMSYVIFGFAFLDIIKARFRIRNFRREYIFLLGSAFILANLHMTYFRTIGGTYLSQYFGNNIVDIIVSPVPKYLLFEYQ